MSIVLGKGTLNAVIVASGVLLLTTLFTLYIFLNTKYIIVGDILKIRTGFIYKKDIDIKRIKSISGTKSLISSPAASFDRIELKYDTYGSIIVSPKEKKSFAKELKNINPNIQII